jgi:uncharacterized membrane-anchored protein
MMAAGTLGTAAGDWVLGDLPAIRRGLGLGLVISTICTSLLLAAIVILWRRRTQRLQAA